MSAMQSPVITYGLYATRRAPRRAPAGAVVSAPNISRGHVFVKPAGGMRIIDELVALGAGAITPIWTVTRPTLGQQLAWGLGIGLIGGIVAMEASGTEIGNFATGASAGNLAAITLRLVHPNLAKP